MVNHQEQERTGFTLTTVSDKTSLFKKKKKKHLYLSWLDTQLNKSK